MSKMEGVSHWKERERKVGKEKEKERERARARARERARERERERENHEAQTRDRASTQHVDHAYVRPKTCSETYIVKRWTLTPEFVTQAAWRMPFGTSDCHPEAL